jgi:hypothetical protein
MMMSACRRVHVKNRIINMSMYIWISLSHTATLPFYLLLQVVERLKQGFANEAHHSSVVVKDYVSVKGQVTLGMTSRYY